MVSTNQDIRALYESLDEEITNCMKAAARACSQGRDLWQPWSLDLWVQGMVCTYWCLLESQIKTGRNFLEQRLALLILFAENKIYVPEECKCMKTIIQGKREGFKKLRELWDNGDDI